MVKMFLGIDGGQSGTVALIADETGRIVGHATAGPCNHVAATEARAKFLRVMRECIGQAAARAGVAAVSGRWPFTSACCGMSGGPADKAQLLTELIAAPHLDVTHDAAIALAGALAGEPGVVVIAGTGSIAFGRNRQGETARAGGWGYVFGDEGGAFDIARQALRAVLCEAEVWGPRTALTPALLAATGAADANQALHLLYTPEWPRSRTATLAMIVDQVAEQGDPVAVEILTKAAQQLALLTGAVRRQLFREEESSATSWIGGVFQSRVLLERFRAFVEVDPLHTCELPRHGPAWGALLLAMRSAGCSVTLQPAVDPAKPLH